MGVFFGLVAFGRPLLSAQFVPGTNAVCPWDKLGLKGDRKDDFCPDLSGRGRCSISGHQSRLTHMRLRLHR